MNTPQEELQGFTPTLLGTIIHFQHAEDGMITDESETDIFIESDFYTGWMPKPVFWESLGIED
jgi:hypothetical protein